MCGSSRPTAVRFREQRCASCKIAKLHAILELNSTLDITRQPRHRNSTALDSPRQQLDAPPHGVSLDRLDRNSTGSTGKASTTASTAARRSLDSSTARRSAGRGGRERQGRDRSIGGRFQHLGFSVQVSFFLHTTLRATPGTASRGPPPGPSCCAPLLYAV